MKKMFLMALLACGVVSVSFGALSPSALTDDEKECIQACRLAKADECLAKMGCASKEGTDKDTCLYECDMELEKECYNLCGAMSKLTQMVPRHGKPLGIEE